MEEKREVDLKIIPDLRALAKEYSQIERYWAKQDIDANVAFPAFHAARNSRIIVEKIIKRFEEHKPNENPKIVSETENVIPLLLEISSRLKAAQEILPETQLYLSRQLFDTTRKLRNTANNMGMLPSLDDELEDVDKKILIEEFDNLRKRWMLEILDM